MRVLHVGCGGEGMPDILEGCEEIRMDIDPLCNPDIVANLTDMGDIGQFDAIYGSHVLEHFSLDDVRKVLSECRRVLKVGGFVIMVVPDLTSIKPTPDVVYQSPAGPITGLDMYYGKSDLVESNSYMAHKIAFTRGTLHNVMAEQFENVSVKSFSYYNLIGTCAKTKE